MAEEILDVGNIQSGILIGEDGKGSFSFTPIKQGSEPITLTTMLGLIELAKQEILYRISIARGGQDERLAKSQAVGLALLAECIGRLAEEVSKLKGRTGE